MKPFCEALFALAWLLFVLIVPAMLGLLLSGF